MKPQNIGINVLRIVSILLALIAVRGLLKLEQAQLLPSINIANGPRPVHGDEGQYCTDGREVVVTPSLNGFVRLITHIYRYLNKAQLASTIDHASRHVRNIHYW